MLIINDVYRRLGMVSIAVHQTYTAKAERAQLTNAVFHAMAQRDLKVLLP
ncbi:MAG TPA: hypothetical protein V6D03_12230 [Candidatus Caenarcaniphilales bacterium]